MEKQASKSGFFGRFENIDEDVQIYFSWDSTNSTVTIVRKSLRKVPEEIISVERAVIQQISSSYSEGECIEKGVLGQDGLVYKKITLNSGKTCRSSFRIEEENNILIEEFQITNPNLKIDHPSKIIGYSYFEFIIVSGEELVEVTKVNLKQKSRRKVLWNSRLEKVDIINVQWNDKPVDNGLLNALKAEIWDLQWTIIHQCCWEECHDPTNLKCARCLHYVCQTHHKVKEEDLDSYLVLCGHCCGIKSDSMCLLHYLNNNF